MPDSYEQDQKEQRERIRLQEKEGRQIAELDKLAKEKEIREREAQVREARREGKAR